MFKLLLLALAVFLAWKSTWTLVITVPIALLYLIARTFFRAVDVAVDTAIEGVQKVAEVSAQLTAEPPRRPNPRRGGRSPRSYPPAPAGEEELPVRAASAHRSTKFNVEELKWLATLSEPTSLDPSDYCHPTDELALRALRQIPLADQLVKALLKDHVAQECARLKRVATKVSAENYPNIDQIARRCCQLLQLRPVPVYITRQRDLNASVMSGDDGHAVIALTGTLVKQLRDRELSFVIGHELAHVKSEHLPYHLVAESLCELGEDMPELLNNRLGEAIGLAAIPAAQALLAWQRRSELTADRVGLICCQDVKAALAALAVVESGSRDDVDDTVQQLLDEETTWADKLLTALTSTHPDTPHRIRQLKEFSASSYYRCEVLRDPVALEARRSLPAVLPPDTRTPQEWLTVEKPSQIAPVLEVFDEMGQEMVLYEDLKSRGRLDEAVIEWLVAHDCLVRWSDAISVTPAGRTLKASLRLAGTQAGQKTGTMMDHAAAL